METVDWCPRKLRFKQTEKKKPLKARVRGNRCKRSPVFKRTRTPKKYVLNGHLQLNSTTQHARSRKCERLPHTNFSIFTLKNVIRRTYFIRFTVQYCFLFRFVSIELVSLIWFLQIWVVIYVFGTMINWSTLIKKLMQTYIVIVSGNILNVSTVHLNGIWHLIWHYLSKPALQHSPRVSA